MEKFAEIINAMRFCAGPDCNEKCPYFNRSANAKSCRSMLLEDATAALTSETMQGECYREKIKRLRDQAAERDAIAAERDKMAKECEELKDYARALEKEGAEARTERDKLNQELTAIIQHRDELAADKNVLREENKALHNERVTLKNKITNLTDKLEAAEGKTDRPSVSSDDLDNLACELQRYRTEAGYWHGKAAALEWFIREWFREGGFAP